MDGGFAVSVSWQKELCCKNRSYKGFRKAFFPLCGQSHLQSCASVQQFQPGALPSLDRCGVMGLVHLLGQGDTLARKLSSQLRCRYVAASSCPGLPLLSEQHHVYPSWQVEGDPADFWRDLSECTRDTSGRFSVVHGWLISCFSLRGAASQVGTTCTCIKHSCFSSSDCLLVFPDSLNFLVWLFALSWKDFGQLAVKWPWAQNEVRGKQLCARHHVQVFCSPILFPSHSG